MDQLRGIPFLGDLLPHPSGAFDWERDAVGFYEKYHYVFLAAAVAYYPTIFGIKALLKDKKGFDLGGAGSKAILNWVFWWELGLAIFSIVGAIAVVPLALRSMATGANFTESVCVQSHKNDPAAYWIFLFNVSKLFEFGDTLFVVLRKKPLILLQHYHHLATMLYCWWGTITVGTLNNTNPFFAAMNLCVHSVMYSWYAATRTGWKSPKVFMMLVTLIQLVQMVVGCYIVLVAQGIVGNGAGCRWTTEDPWGAKACTFMYASYLVLFAKLFKDNYLTHAQAHKYLTGKPEKKLEGEGKKVK